MIIDKIKTALRMDCDDLDEDIQDTIEAAKSDLILSGVKEAKITEDDPLILRAIKVFCKAEFSSDNVESNRFRKSYEMLRDHLSLSTEYSFKEEINNVQH